MQNFKILGTIFQFFNPTICHNLGGGAQFVFKWNVILLLTQDHMQKFKILRPFFNFFTPQYVIVRGVRGEVSIFFWLECYSIGNSGPHAKIWNPTINFQFFHPPISHSAGGRGGSRFFFWLECYFFGNSGAHAKFQNCSTNPSGRNSPFWPFPAQNWLF